LTLTLNWNWALMFNTKLEVGLDVNIKLGPISLKVYVQGTLELRLGLDSDVKLGPVNCS